MTSFSHVHAWGINAVFERSEDVRFPILPPLHPGRKKFSFLWFLLDNLFKSALFFSKTETVLASRSAPANCSRWVLLVPFNFFAFTIHRLLVMEFTRDHSGDRCFSKYDLNGVPFSSSLIQNPASRIENVLFVSRYGL